MRAAAPMRTPSASPSREISAAAPDIPRSSTPSRSSHGEVRCELIRPRRGPDQRPSSGPQDDALDAPHHDATGSDDRPAEPAETSTAMPAVTPGQVIAGFGVLAALALLLLGRR